ncbi:MAG: hypothetical protein ACD_72C00561G0006 [uncultured bacterium]|nr:MAG: hypothetical protein ACD_72C00561G0006 [uncultured bacterium]
MPKQKKNFNPKKPQLRRCAFCDKSGHNKSTCSDYLKSFVKVNSSPATIAPIKFFVHHVSHEPTTSPHVVNLKKDVSQAWHNVATIAPEIHHSIDFNNAYEKIKQEIQLSKKIEPKDINQKIFVNLSKNSQIEDNIEKTPVSINVLPPELAPKKQKYSNQSSWTFTKFFELGAQKINLAFKKATNAVAIFLRENFVFRKLAVSTAILMIILVAPGSANSYYQNIILTKDKIAQDSTAGFLSLQNSTVALMQADLPTAQLAIDNAMTNFSSAVETMQNNHQFLQKVASFVPVLDTEVRSRQSLLLAGQKIAQGNTYFLKGIAQSQTDASSTLNVRLETFNNYLTSAIPNYKEALNYLETVDNDSLPLAYQGPFKEFKKIFTAVLHDLQNLSSLNGVIKEIFGTQGQRRYLLVFQNPSELRPTGGFLGSIAVMDIKDGKIINLDVPAGGSYDLQGQLDQFIEPPTPLLLVNKRWEFQDSNWFPDFPASAQKMMWFYRHSRNITVDGVIAINSTVLERLLAITGPISDDKRGLTLSSENALVTIQKIVEEGPEKKDHRPKQIISDLAPQFIDRFTNSQPKDLVPLIVNLQEALSKKEVQAYFTDQAAQTAITDFGWSGKILNTNNHQDYLAVFNTNMLGQKSDDRISQTISHQAVVDRDGTITDTVVISRTHSGNPEEKMYGATNIDYIRLYVPKNSELISANGFTWPDENSFKVPKKSYKVDDYLKQMEKEIKIDDRTGTRVTEEFDKTSFGNWVITEPGQTSKIEFTYKLPFKLSVIDQNANISWQKIVNSKQAERYQLVVQKQSGINSLFESQIIFPNDWQPNYKEGDDIELAKNGASITSITLDTDRVWGLVMEK